MSGRVRLTPGLRRVAPDLLVGGSPPRLLRLSDTGAAALDAVLSGQEHPRAADLRRRLLTRGALQPDPASAPIDTLTVVIPAHCGAEAVRAVLDPLPSSVPVVVVDDASPDPLASAFPDHTVLRHSQRRGPAAARNTGAATVRTDLIAFIDADVELPPTCLPRMAGHFCDQGVVAVAPRITSGSTSGWVGVLEEQLCALDLGTQAALVAKGSAVSYLPATVLVVRREAFVAVGGFNEDLHVGEDVDLVWRLAELGRVHYDPSESARHEPRTSLSEALRRRRDYGASAGELDRLHPGAVRHLSVAPVTALPWLAAGVAPSCGLLAAAGAVVVAPDLLPGLPAREARRLLAAGLWQQALGIGRYAVRPALPLTIAGFLLSRRARRLAPVLLLAYLAAHYPRLSRGPTRDAARRLALTVLDDLAYSAGVWTSAIQDRRPGVLLPALSRTHLRTETAPYPQ